jgi:hypothetical protein
MLLGLLLFVTGINLGLSVGGLISIHDNKKLEKQLEDILMNMK